MTVRSTATFVIDTDKDDGTKAISETKGQESPACSVKSMVILVTEADKDDGRML